MIVELLQREEFVHKPPVLLDIGAAGSLPESWKEIDPYSICVAFDGDERDFEYIEKKRKFYKKLIVVNKVVSIDGGEIDFYLTRSPHCSSTLKTDTATLSNYAFAELFLIDQTIKVQSVKLSAVLTENNIAYVDWFKTDTQGTDLRIIQTLDESIVNTVLVYDLEPGIIDAYEGEDKLFDVLAFFNQKKFFVLDAVIKGSYRVNMSLLKKKLPDHIANNISQFLPSTPDWCEVSFFNSFTTDNLTIREYLLGWIFATTRKQYGLALEIADKGECRFGDLVFNRMTEHTLHAIKDKFDVPPAALPSTPTFKRRLINFLERL